MHVKLPDTMGNDTKFSYTGLRVQDLDGAIGFFTKVLPAVFLQPLRVEILRKLRQNR